MVCSCCGCGKMSRRHTLLVIVNVVVMFVRVSLRQSHRCVRLALDGLQRRGGCGADALGVHRH